MSITLLYALQWRFVQSLTLTLYNCCKSWYRYLAESPVDAAQFNTAARAWLDAGTDIVITACGRTVVLTLQEVSSDYIVGSGLAKNGKKCADAFNAKASKSTGAASSSLNGTATSATVITPVACLLVVIALIITRRRSRVLAKNSGVETRYVDTKNCETPCL